MPGELPADPCEEHDDGRVVMSLTVFSSEPIEELAEYRADSPKQQTAVRYDVASMAFNAPDAHLRADRLQSEIEGMLMRLATVPSEVLHDKDTFVRLFITFPRGAQTLHARTVTLMAARNVTLWVDA